MEGKKYNDPIFYLNQDMNYVITSFNRNSSNIIEVQSLLH